MKHTLMSPITTLAILADIKEQVNKPDNEHCHSVGICNLFKRQHEYHIEECLKQAGVNWSNWPKYSGRSKFPVPAIRKNLDPENEYFYTENLWDKEKPYCQSRHELLDWLIEQLTIVINNMEKPDDQTAAV